MAETIHKGCCRAVAGAYWHSQNSILVAEVSPWLNWPPPERWPSHHPPSSFSPGLELGMIGVKGNCITTGVRMQPPTISQCTAQPGVPEGFPRDRTEDLPQVPLSGAPAVFWLPHRSMRNNPRHLPDVLSEGFWKTDGQTEVWDEVQWRGCRS